MKKVVTLVVWAILLVFVFTGCAEYTYEQKEIQALVVKCEEHTTPNAAYLSMSEMYLAQNQIALWSMYRSMAYANVQHDYLITVDMDGIQYTLIRDDAYRNGQYITVICTETYCGEKLIKTEYK